MGESFFTLWRLFLTSFDHLQRFIQPVEVGLLKFNGNGKSSSNPVSSRNSHQGKGKAYGTDLCEG
jgi:hypothetical protein